MRLELIVSGKPGKTKMRDITKISQEESANSSGINNLSFETVQFSSSMCRLV